MPSQTQPEPKRAAAAELNCSMVACSSCGRDLPFFGAGVGRELFKFLVFQFGIGGNDLVQVVDIGLVVFVVVEMHGWRRLGARGRNETPR